MRRFRCPSGPSPLAAGPRDVVEPILGCGAEFNAEPDDEGLLDCPECGIYFRADEPNVEIKENTMKNVKPKTTIMRDDYTFSVTPQRIQVHPIGFEQLYAGPGDWINFGYGGDSAATGVGRVIGVATTTAPETPTDTWSGTFLMVAALGSRGHVGMAWIRPEWVAASMPGPPKRAMEFLCGEWNDPQAICKTIENGILEDYARSPKPDAADEAFIRQNLLAARRRAAKALLLAVGPYDSVLADFDDICEVASKSAAALDALQVLLKTPHIRAYLKEHDPKALEQAQRAVEGEAT